jgi:hypothetical protein
MSTDPIVSEPELSLSAAATQFDIDNLTTASGEERSGAELEAESTASAESVAGGSASHH